MKTEDKKYHFETMESYGPEDYCHYSGLPSPSAYENVDMDGMGDQGRTVKYEYQKNKVMKQLEKYYPIIFSDNGKDNLRSRIGLIYKNHPNNNKNNYTK